MARFILSPFLCFDVDAFRSRKWGDLADSAKGEVDGLELQELWKEELREPYLSLFVLGSFRGGAARWPELSAFVEASRTDDSHWDWLVRWFGPQLAVMSMVRDDWDRAEHIVTQSLNNFLLSWQTLHPLARKGKVNLLQSLQLLREIQEVVEFARDDRNFRTMRPLSKLLERWAQRWPSVETDDVIHWDMLAFCRASLLDKLQHRFLAYLRGDSCKLLLHHMKFRQLFVFELFVFGRLILGAFSSCAYSKIHIYTYTDVAHIRRISMCI